MPVEFLPPPPGQDPPPPKDPPPPPPEEAEQERPRTLSNETTLSRWAYVERSVWARREPTAGSKRVRRLREFTQDGTPELVLLLSDWKRRSGTVWVKVRLPMRPNGTTGWVLRSRLGAYRTVTQQLVINRRSFRATLYDGEGKRIWTSHIGVGQRRWPTPAGRFYVRERLVPREKDGIYGVFAFGTSAYSPVLTDWPGGGVIGVHGTNRPEILPGRVSHGCVRVPNPRISKLRRLMSLGTPILIK